MSAVPQVVDPVQPSDEEREKARRIYSKISWRLIPYIFILYILAYLDRVNVGFAAVEFQRDLHLSASVYGLAPVSSSSAS